MRFVDDELEVGPDCRLERTITLVCLLCDGSSVGDTGIEDEAAEAKESKDVGIQAARSAIALDYHPPSSHGRRIRIEFHDRIFDIFEKHLIVHSPLVI
jgi:hypothetical protein